MSAVNVCLEPPCYGMTGRSIGLHQQMRHGADWDAIQPLDAPEYIARGSVIASTPVQPGNLIYASTTDPMPARMLGAKP